MNQKKLFGLLVKYPEAGKVKTRLARDIGIHEAAAAYKRIAEDVLRKTLPSGGEYERIICYSPSYLKERFEVWLPGERLISQRGEDLGAVMNNALKSLFNIGASEAVIAGADVPELNEAIIEQAFREIEQADIVIGPAADGGYYLIGMKACRPGIFRDISWSTDRVFKETVSVIEKLGLTYRTTVTLSDVDRVEDLLSINRGAEWNFRA
jgi:rSAM/selenodomain-associated transferase 1